MVEEEREYEEMSTYRLHQLADDRGISEHHAMERDELIEMLRGGRQGATA